MESACNSDCGHGTALAVAMQGDVVRGDDQEDEMIHVARKAAQANALGLIVLKASMAAGAGFLAVWFAGTVAFMSWGGG